MTAVPKNYFPEDVTGDGYSLAYRAGAEFVNLEFIQIMDSCPWKVIHEGGLSYRLYNSLGEKYIPEGVELDRCGFACSY